MSQIGSSKGETEVANAAEEILKEVKRCRGNHKKQ